MKQKYPFAKDDNASLTFNNQKLMFDDTSINQLLSSSRLTCLAFKMMLPLKTRKPVYLYFSSIYLGEQNSMLQKLHFWHSLQIISCSFAYIYAQIIWGWNIKISCLKGGGLCQSPIHKEPLYFMAIPLQKYQDTS